MEAGALVAATEWLEIGDRATVLDGSAWGNVTNSGTGVVRIGTDAHVGSVWTKGLLDLRDRVTVHGNVVSATLSQGNQVSILGSVSTQLPSASDILRPAPSFANIGGAVSLEPNQQRTLGPGHYGSLSVKSGGQLHLREGAYSFANITVEPQAVIHVESNCSAVSVRNRGAFYFRGSVVEVGGNDAGVGISIVHESQQTAFVEAPFRGIILAPNAELVLSAHTHRGQFLARRLRIDADATVRSVEPFPADPAACGAATIAPLPTGVTEPLPDAAAPPLDGAADLDDFLNWYYFIRASQLAEAKGRISAVGSSAALVEAVIDRLEAARQADKIGRVVMLLSFLGAMSAPEAEDYLIGVVEEPMPNVPDDPPGDTGQFSPWDYEVAYRTKAMQVLHTMASVEGLAAVVSTAESHPAADLRHNAIALLVFAKDQAFRDGLKANLAPDDQHLVDRPHSAEDGDLQARIAAYTTEYGGAP